jgi:hypothetical protein
MIRARLLPISALATAGLMLVASSACAYAPPPSGGPGIKSPPITPTPAPAPSSSPSSAPSPAPQTAQPLTLLYDSIPDRDTAIRVRAMGVERWTQINQDPNSYTTGVIDVQAVLKQIEDKTGGKPGKWMMLDFEEPFFADLLRPRDSPEYKRAVKSMTGTMRAVKGMYPDSKWAFYGIPNLSYWIDGKGWATAPRELQEAKLKQMADACLPILADADWVSVSIYDYYDPKLVIAGSPNSIRGTPEGAREDGRAWRTAQVGLAKLLAQGKPVIPNVFPYWAPGGIAPYCRLLPPRKFMEDQIIPAVKAGATGFAIWAGLQYRIDQVIDGGKDPAYVTKEKNFGIPEWRAAFTADYLGGVAPTNWRDPSVRTKLSVGTSKTMVDTIANIRDWEKTGQLQLPPIK